MERKSDIRAEIDNARLMTKLSVIGGIITVVVLLVPVLIFGVIKPDLIGSDVFSLGVIPYSLAVVFAFAASSLLCSISSEQIQYGLKYNFYV